MTQGQPPRRPPPPPPLPSLENVRPIEERFAPPPGQRGAPPQRPHPAEHYARHAAARQQQPAQRRRRRSGLLTALVVGALGLGVVIAAGASVLLLNPPTDLIRDQAVAAVKARTGRDLVISGPARLTLYPSLGVTLNDVSLSAPPGMGGAPTVEMASLDVSVKLVPLISRRVEVSRLVLTRPKFDLRVDKAGRRSWDFASASDPTPARVQLAEANSGTMQDVPRHATHTITLAQAAAPAQPGAGQRGAARIAALEDLVLEDVRILDGTLTYADARSASTHTATSIDVTVKARTLAKPLTAKGDLDWQGQTVKFDGTLTTLAEVLADKPAKLALEIAAKPLTANYTGSIDPKSTALEGDVSARSASLRALAAWLGHALPHNEGFGQLSLAGRLKSQPGAFRLDNADIGLDQMQVKGWLSGATTGTRPQIKADLKVSELNLNTYIGHGGAVAEQPAAAGAAPAAEKPAAPSAPAPSPQSIEDLLHRDAGPKVKGYTAREGWSDEPLDVALLGLVDADAKLSVGKLVVRDVTVGQSDLQLALKNRIAKTTFERVALYDGHGRGTITIDASGAMPAIAANLVVEDIAAEPLLKDAAAIDWLSGKGRLTLASTSQGQTQRQLVSGLNGKATFAFADGAIRGFNVAKALRGLQQGKLTGLTATPAEKTDFSELSASFDISSGIATNKDLTLMNPLLRVSGEGTVDLPGRRVDYTARPKLVANLSGQGGETGLGGLEVPLRITGHWAKPQIAPDLEKVDAKQAVEAVQQLGERLKGKNAGEVVDEIFGKDSKEGRKAKKFLDQLFR